MVHREKELKKEQVNGIESILLNGCTTTVIRNYRQKLSGKSESYAADVSAALRCRPHRINICSCWKDTWHARNLPEPIEFPAVPLPGLPEEFWSKFQAPVVV
ncbi:hypothetical protein TNCV_2826931 [Trichonephila clavipes]|nr:hypothetical protein TNCV_2826931 [Trichonephila clavipes]